VDAQESKVVLGNETPAADLLSQKTWKAFPVPDISGMVAPVGRNSDTFSSDKEYNVDTGRNAFIATVQRTPEHSWVLTLNSYQSILSIPHYFLTKARKRVSLNNRAVALKTHPFSVKQPSHRTMRKAPLAILSERKERVPSKEVLKRLVFLVCAKGIKCKTCGLVY
jgi:hypothetical protein